MHVVSFKRHTPSSLNKPDYDTPDMRRMFADLFDVAIANYPHTAHVHGRDTFREMATTLNRPWYVLRNYVIQTFGEDGVPPPLQPTMHLGGSNNGS